MRGFFVLILCVIIMVMNGPAYGEISNRVVAVVNDEVITLYELNKRIEELTGHTPDDIQSDNEEQFIETRRNILESMINEKIALDKAKELGLEVTQSEIDAYIENIKATNQMTQEDLLAQLEAEGVPYERFRKRIKEEMERNRLIEYEVQGKTIVRKDQIINYYQEHKDEFKKEGRVEIASILLMKDGTNNPEESINLEKKGKRIIEKIKEGKDFNTLAKEFSEGPGADEGGFLGSFKVSEIDPEILEVLKGLPEGGVSDLIDRGNALQIIKLINREEETITPFEEVRNKIYNFLYQKEINKRYTSWIKELREDSFTKIIF